LGLVRFLEERHPRLWTWGEVKRHPHIEDWLCELQSRSPTTRLNALQIVGQFFAEVREWGWRDPPGEDLFLRTDVPKLPVRCPQALDRESDRRLTEALEAHPCVRCFALQLMRETGMRVGETLKLGMNAASRNREGHWELKVPPTKTQTERVIPLMPSARRVLEAIESRRGAQVPGERLPDRLVVDERGRLIPHWTLQRHIKKMACVAGLAHWQRVHLHQLRHTFASEMARAQMPLPSLMRLLGHRKPQMTMRYIELSTVDVRRAYEQAIQRLPLLEALKPVEIQHATVSAEGDRPVEQLRAVLAALERQRRDAPAGSPEAARLHPIVRRLQGLLRSLEKQP